MKQRIRKIKETFLSSRKQLVRYFITGVSGVFFDLLTLYILKEFFKLGPVWAVAINQLIMYTYVFLMNKYWTFGVRGMTHRQMIKFYSLAIVNYLFSITWMWILNNRLGVNYLVARTGNIGLSTSWNFLLYKLWVYRQ